MIIPRSLQSYLHARMGDEFASAKSYEPHSHLTFFSTCYVGDAGYARCILTVVASVLFFFAFLFALRRQAAVRPQAVWFWWSDEASVPQEGRSAPCC
jgi:hypothetical protein